MATLIARYVAPDNPLPGWHSQEQAWATTQGQLAWYRAMEERGELVQIRDRARAGRAPRELGIAGARTLRSATSSASKAPTRSSRSRTSSALYAQGLRAVGPAHYGPGVYAQGTNATGGRWATRGRELLREMDRLGIILDVTHLCDDSFRDALDRFTGTVWASHSNCRSLVPHERQFTDDQIRELIERDAVIGVVFDAWMLVPGWVRGESTPERAGVTLNTVIDHIDRICQIAGNAQHCGIGSDLDGAFGREQCPADVQTIADLARIPALLQARGYRDDDIAGSCTRQLHQADAESLDAVMPTPALQEHRRYRRRVISRVNRRLIPFAFLCYVVAYIDRVNVGFAAQALQRDLHLSDTAYGFGAGLFFLGYCLFEVPSNLILERVGARRWIARIMIGWGFVSMAMMFVTGPRSFYAARVLLGIAEAGFFPGFVLYLTYWIPAAERARTGALFMMAAPVSIIVGAPVSEALLALDGRLGLTGGNGCSLVEGLPAVVLGFLAPRVLTDRPEQATWLPAADRDWLAADDERGARAAAPRRARIAARGRWRAAACGCSARCTS